MTLVTMVSLLPRTEAANNVRSLGYNNQFDSLSQNKMLKNKTKKRSGNK